ncbi:hypothetical protein [Leptolyngbya sp. CCY15150]|nr:hypothetical protein [Leptolyngbya sp. CCY15150]
MITFIGISVTLWRAIAAGRVESDRFIEDFMHVIEQVWEYKTI